MINIVKPNDTYQGIEILFCWFETFLMNLTLTIHITNYILQTQFVIIVL